MITKSFTARLRSLFNFIYQFDNSAVVFGIYGRFHIPVFYIIRKFKNLRREIIESIFARTRRCRRTPLRWSCSCHAFVFVFCNNFSNSNSYIIPSSNAACSYECTLTLFWYFLANGSTIGTFSLHSASCRRACSGP